MSSEEDSDFSESEINLYGEKEYELMKQGKNKVRFAENVFRCPFCLGKKKVDYLYKDILQHALGIASSPSKSAKQKANHLALSRYLETELAPVVVKGQPEVEADPPIERNNDEFPIERNNDEFFVFPWMGVVANLPTEWKDRKYVGESGSKLRDQLTRQGFNPVKVQPLWNCHGHSGYAIVIFKKDWPGFHNAMSFEKFFEVDHHGKRDWYAKKDHGTSLYGWVARDDDYYSMNIVGKHLEKNGDLKTTPDIVAEEERKTNKLFSKLANDMEVKSMKMKEIECKYNETNLSLSNLMNQNDKLHQKYNDEILKMQQPANNHFQRICQEHNKVKSELDTQRMELEHRGAELEKREAQNETERNKLAEENLQNATKNSSLEIASEEQKKADENVLKLAEDQKGLGDIMSFRAQIGVKRMGELDSKPFHEACKRKYGNGSDEAH